MEFIKQPIFLMLNNKEGYNRVIDADSYLTDKTNQYISEERKDMVKYTILKEDNTVLEFSIYKFDYKSAGLSGTYDDFYEYRIENNTHIVSPNKEKLKGFCGWINRLTQ